MYREREVHMFQLGDVADWHPEERDSYIQQYHGDGPFRIVGVANLPKGKCTCGLTKELEEYGFPHESRCDISSLESVGHPQWVEVEIRGNKERFSGAYFIPAKLN